MPVYVILEVVDGKFMLACDGYYDSHEAAKAALNAMLEANGDMERGTTSLCMKRLKPLEVDYEFHFSF